VFLETVMKQEEEISDLHELEGLLLASPLINKSNCFEEGWN